MISLWFYKLCCLAALGEKRGKEIVRVRECQDQVGTVAQEFLGTKVRPNVPGAYSYESAFQQGLGPSRERLKSSALTHCKSL